MNALPRGRIRNTLAFWAGVNACLYLWQLF
jgi:hypothetical protein